MLTKETSDGSASVEFDILNKEEVQGNTVRLIRLGISLAFFFFLSLSLIRPIAPLFNDMHAVRHPRTLITLTQTLKPLPKQRWLKMQLLYRYGLWHLSSRTSPIDLMYCLLMPVTM